MAKTNSFIDTINTEFEQSFTSAAIISKELNCIEESQLAAKRVFSYNPNSKTILNLFPQYSPIIDEILSLVENYTQQIKEDSNKHEYWI